MPLNMRSPDAGSDGTPAHAYPISRSLAMLVLIALVLLFALRHIFGSFNVSGGVK